MSFANTVRRRLLLLVFVVFGVTVITFIISHMIPGDPARLMAGERATPEIVDNMRRQLGLDRPYQQSAGLMEQAAQRCSSVVQNLLNYTRKSGDEAEQVDLNEIVKSTLSLLQHNLQQADIQLQVVEGDPPALKGNFTELCTVVTNLVLNARDAALAMKQEDGPDGSCCRAHAGAGRMRRPVRPA